MRPTAMAEPNTSHEPAVWIRQIQEDDGISLLQAIVGWIDDQRAGFKKLDRVFTDLCGAEENYSRNLNKLQKRKEVVSAANLIGSAEPSGLLGALGHALRIAAFPGCHHDRSALSASLSDLAQKQSAMDARFVSLRKRVQAVLSNCRSDLGSSRGKVASLRVKLEKCIREGDRAIIAAKVNGSPVVVGKALVHPAECSENNAPPIVHSNSTSSSIRGPHDKCAVRAEQAITDTMHARRDYWNACYVLAQQRRAHLRVVLGVLGQFRQFFTGTLRAVSDSLRVAMKSTVVLILSRTEALSDASSMLENFVDDAQSKITSSPASPVSSVNISTLRNRFGMDKLIFSPTPTRTITAESSTPSPANPSSPINSSVADTSIDRESPVFTGNLLLPPTPEQVSAGTKISEKKSSSSQASDAAYKNSVEYVEKNKIILKGLAGSLRYSMSLLEGQAKSLKNVVSAVPEFIGFSGNSNTSNTVLDDESIGPAACLSRRMVRGITRRAEHITGQRQHIGDHVVSSVEQIINDQRSDLRSCDEYYRQLTAPEGSRPENFASLSSYQIASMVNQMATNLRTRENDRARNILSRFAQAQAVALQEMQALSRDLDAYMSKLPSLDADSSFQSWAKCCPAMSFDSPEMITKKLGKRRSLTPQQCSPSSSPKGSPRSTSVSKIISSPTLSVSSYHRSPIHHANTSPLPDVHLPKDVITPEEIHILDCLADIELSHDTILTPPSVSGPRHCLQGKFIPLDVIQRAEEAVAVFAASVCCQDATLRRKGKLKRHWAGPARFNGTLQVQGTCEVLKLEKGDTVSLILLCGVTWCGFAPDGSYFDTLSHEFVSLEDDASDSTNENDQSSLPTITTELELFKRRFSREQAKELLASFSCMCTPHDTTENNSNTDTVGRLYITDSILAFYAKDNNDSDSVPTKIVYRGSEIIRVGRRILTPGCVEIGLRSPENAVCSFFGFALRDHAQEFLQNFVSKHDLISSAAEHFVSNTTAGSCAVSVSNGGTLEEDDDEEKYNSDLKVERVASPMPYPHDSITPLATQAAGPRWRYSKGLPLEQVFNAFFGDYGEGSLVDMLHKCQDEFNVTPNPEPVLDPPFVVWNVDDASYSFPQLASRRVVEMQRKVKANPVAEKLVSLPSVCGIRDEWECRAIAPGQLACTMKCQVNGLPFSDRFVIHTRYILTEIKTHEEAFVQLDAEWEMVFIKSCWMQHQVRSLAMKEFHANLVKHVFPTYEFKLSQVLGQDPVEATVIHRRPSSVVNEACTVTDAVSTERKNIDSDWWRLIPWGHAFLFLLCALVYSLILDLKALQADVAELRIEVARMRNDI
eukprot:gene672-409_t